MSLSRNYPRNTTSIRMYSVVYPESNFGGFPGMVPEWFRKCSIYRVRIYWCNLMRIRFPVALSAKICVTLSIVLSSYVGGPSERLKEYVSFPHSTFLGFPESVCMRSVDGCGTESISIVVITIWLRVVA